LDEHCFLLRVSIFGGEWICFHIPILIDRHWYDPNPPDPRVILDRERLQEWVSVDSQAIPQLADLPILATMNLLASQLSDEQLRGQLTETMQQVSEQVSQQLPEGASLGGFKS
jgi:hypothetical protein